MKEIYISALAKKENEENVDYVLGVFGMASALDYIDKYDEAIRFLGNNIYGGVFDKKLGLHKFLVVK